MNRRSLAGVSLAVLLATPALAAETFVIDKAHSEASFQVPHLGISKVRGRFTDFEGRISIDRAKPEASWVEFAIKTASIDTLESKRDAHLRSADFFDAETHPTISFKSTKVVPKGPDQFEVTGTFTLRGVSKQITLPVKLVGFLKTPWNTERVGFETGTTLKRKEYGVSWSKTLDNGGLIAGDEVIVSLTIEAERPLEAASK